MDIFEIKDALESFRVLVDTREHQTPQAARRITAFGVPSERCTLSYGDYCADIAVKDRQSIFADTDEKAVKAAIKPRCVVERKQSLDELAMCFTRGRDRFRREFERAADSSAKVYLLVENGGWDGIAAHRYRSRFNPDAFRASLISWMIRYDFSVVFCRADLSGPLIKEILYRDMKARLEGGEFG